MLLLINLALILGVIGMFLTWRISIRIKNAGIVDIAWALSLSVIVMLYGILGSGAPMRRLMITVMVLVWSLRLALHLYQRVMRAHPVEDVRYQELRKKWSQNVDLKFFIFFESQALLSVVLSIPFLLSCINPQPQIHFLEWLGFLVWVGAIFGESLADLQLKKFKSDPANKGKVCRIGLWNYSRHPNYFFEWLVWCAYFIFALASPYGYLTFYCPLIMLYFLLKVTGIPFLEEQAVKTKGESYVQYQRTTSAFVPWLKKR